MDRPHPFNRTPFVRVINVGQQMGDGWRRIDRGGPWSRFLAGLTAILLAVPILLIGLLLLVTLAAFGIAAALVSLVIGRRPGRREVQIEGAAAAASGGQPALRPVR